MKNRIRCFEMVKPDTLAEHPKNWRVHPNTQENALREALDKIGIVNAVICYDSPSSGLRTIIDGHLRRELEKREELIPAIVLDVDDKEAEAILLTHDPIGAMALADDEIMQGLLDGLSSDASMADLLAMVHLGEMPGDDSTEGLGDAPKQPDAKYPIVPIYDESYDAVIIISSRECEWTELQTMLPLPKRKDRNGKIGQTHVITVNEFLGIIRKYIESHPVEVA